MFDWRELLLRNQNQSPQINRTTLKLLEEQLLQLLPPIVNALNATNILPLEPTWSKNEIAQEFKIILEVVEQRYLVAWDHVRNGQIQKLQAEYQTWYQVQLRSDRSLYRTYCQWQESLIQQHPQGWSSWILLSLKENSFLAREFKREQTLTPETEFFLAEFFRCAKPLLQIDADTVLKEFYSFQAAFTKQTPFLPQLFQEISNASQKEIFERLEDNEFVEAARIFWKNVFVSQ